MFKDLPLDSKPREKLLKKGVFSLTDAELLAILLRTGTEGKDVLQMAHELLQPPPIGFGGMAGLLHASADDLGKIKGLGPAKRAEIMAVVELAKRALAQTLGERDVMSSIDSVKHYLQLHLSHKKHEVFAVLFLDSKHHLLGLEELFQGSVNEANVYPREILVRALHHNATALVLCHNHPSGHLQPSMTDIELTHTLQNGLDWVDIQVLDHIIVGQGGAVSMAELALLLPYPLKKM